MKKKAEASRIRSKVNWYEKRGKSTKYFFNLEKKKGKKNYGIELKLTMANIKRILCLF